MRATFAALLFVCVLVAPTARADDVGDARQKALEGDFTAAVTHAQAALKADPEDAATARFLQDLLRRLGRTEEATKLLETLGSPLTVRYLRARVLPPKDAVKALKKMKSDEAAPPTVRLDLAAALLAAGKATNADTEAKAYVKLSPEDAEGKVMLGRVALARGNARGARGPLEDALELVPGHASAAVLLADVLHALEEAQQARVVLTTALEHYSSNPDLRIGLSTDQVRARELDNALATLQALTKERARYAPGFAHLAHVQRLLDELAEAEVAAKKALTLDSQNLLALETAGFCLYKKDEIEKAMDEYGKVVQLDPRRIEPYVILGICSATLKRLDDAKDLLETALAIDKEHIDANLKRGVIAYLRGKHKTARKHLSFVVKENSRIAEARRYLGYVHLADGKAKEAQKELEAALQMEPGDPLTVRMLGRALFDLGKKEDAIARFEEAVELDEKDAWAHFDLGKAREDFEEYEAAREEYEKAMELDPKLCWPNIYLAEILDWIDGDGEQALNFYKKFLELGGPDPDKDYEKRIKQIEKDLK